MYATNPASPYPLPFGLLDLDPQVVLTSSSPRRVRCYVRGCWHVLETPAMGKGGEICPQHGIRCHYSSGKATYSYADPRRNTIVDPELLATRVIGHPFKYESHRLGSECSEDMLTWNVFRSLQEAACLKKLAEAITGDATPLEPFLYLWGICLDDGGGRGLGQCGGQK